MIMTNMARHVRLDGTRKDIVGECIEKKRIMGFVNIMLATFSQGSAWRDI
jgi:hypothetical protein